MMFRSPSTHRIVACLVAFLLAASSHAQEDEVVTRALRDFRERGGRITQDDKAPGKPVTVLDLHRIRVTDADMIAVAKMIELEVFDVSYTQVGDAGLKHIGRLPKLRLVALHGSRVTDSGLANLAQLGNLEFLFLAETEVGDDGLRRLEGLKKLQSLELDRTKITDKGMETLGKLPSLRRLVLHHTVVTDAGIERLKSLATLQSVDLFRTKTTLDGIRTLQAALPKTRIDR